MKINGLSTTDPVEELQVLSDAPPQKKKIFILNTNFFLNKKHKCYMIYPHPHAQDEIATSSFRLKDKDTQDKCAKFKTGSPDF